jgi:hypothetical protein
MRPEFKNPRSPSAVGVPVHLWHQCQRWKEKKDPVRADFRRWTENPDADLQGKRGDGARRIRTADLLGAIQALCQLSYSPEMGELQVKRGWFATGLLGSLQRIGLDLRVAGPAAG